MKVPKGLLPAVRVLIAKRRAHPYRSAIPSVAIERIIDTYGDGAKKRAEYLVDGEVVGIRDFDPGGELEGEYPRRAGRPHGMHYFWHEGVLLAAEPFQDGLEHGVARQWLNGKLFGTYRMRHGTGIDLWRDLREDGSVYLSEARYYQDGQRNGFEWWINEDQRSVWQEGHYCGNAAHGIERQWNAQGRLSRGYPKYWVRGRQVSKRAYIASTQRDASLPKFREADNLPARRFPRQVAEALCAPRIAERKNKRAAERRRPA